MRAIITRGLYTFYPVFEGQKRLFKELFFHKILTLCMVSIQERVIIKSGLWWRTYGILMYATKFEKISHTDLTFT